MILKEISPYFFENKLIISLSRDWLRLFKEVPKFKVTLDKRNRLVLQSQEIQQRSLRENSLSELKKVEMIQK